MDTKMMRRAGAIGVGLLLAGSVGAAAQEPVAGYTWELFDPVGAEDEFGISGIATGEGGRLAIFGSVLPGGKDPSVETVWLSEDGGQSWTESTTLNEPDYIVLPEWHDRDEDEWRFTATIHDDLLVTAHAIPGGTKWTYIVTSPDGIHWRIAAKLKNVRAEKLISTPDGLAMLGLDFRKAKGFGKSLAGYPTLWLSDDAVDWEASEISTPLYKPKGLGPQALDAIARADDGTWMASGRVAKFDRKTDTVDVQPSIWSAGADLEWTEVAAPLPNDRHADSYIFAGVTPSGFLYTSWLFDRDAQTFDSGLWLSADGTDWKQVAAADTPTVERVVCTRSGCIGWAAPFVFTHPDYDLETTEVLAGAPMYRSTDGQTWEHDPEADVIEGISVDGVHATPDGHVIIEGQDITGCEGQNIFCAISGLRPRVILIGTPE